MLLFVKRIVGVNETDAAEYRQRGADQHLICRSRGNRLPPQIGGFGNGRVGGQLEPTGLW